MEAHRERDVVCGMMVEPAKAAGTSEYEGKRYFFCGKGCKAKFDAEPEKYVKPGFGTRDSGFDHPHFTRDSGLGIRSPTCHSGFGIGDSGLDATHP